MRPIVTDGSSMVCWSVCLALSWALQQWLNRLITCWGTHWRHLVNLYILNVVRCSCVRSYVRNGGRGQLSSEWRHNENDVTMTITGLWRYGDWRYVATGCTALVWLNCACVAAMRPLVKLVWLLVLCLPRLFLSEWWCRILIIIWSSRLVSWNPLLKLIPSDTCVTVL